MVVTRLLQLLKISLLLVCFNAYAAGLAGLTYQTYRGTGAYPNYTTLTYPTVLSTGTSSAINYNWGSGYVLDSGRTEQVMVHWTGYIKWPGTSGSTTVAFYNSSDDGFLLKINNTTVINNWVEQGNAYYNSSGSITLTAGQSYYIDVWYYENGGGAVAQMYWTYSGQDIQIVPTTNLATTSTYWQPQYSSSITPAQQTRKTSETTQRLNQSGNEIQIEQIGSNNNITIRQGTTISGKNRIELYSNGDGNTLNINQGYTANGTSISGDGNNHYQYLHSSGNSNNITTSQTGNGHFMENTISGNNNTLNYTQTNNGSKTLFSNVNGNSNTINATQSGTGTHYLDINLTGNGHSVTSNQSGAGNHAATIDFTNSGGASSLNLTQGGSTNQIYNIQQSCTNPAGCSTTITQP